MASIKINQANQSKSSLKVIIDDKTGYMIEVLFIVSHSL